MDAARLCRPHQQIRSDARESAHRCAHSRCRPGNALEHVGGKASRDDCRFSGAIAKWIGSRFSVRGSLIIHSIVASAPPTHCPEGQSRKTPHDRLRPFGATRPSSVGPRWRAKVPGTRSFVFGGAIADAGNRAAKVVIFEGRKAPGPGAEGESRNQRRPSRRDIRRCRFFLRAQR